MRCGSWDDDMTMPDTDLWLDGQPENYLRPETGAPDTVAPVARYAGRSKPVSWLGMLFGKRERRINRILIVEDEPLIAFDNEHLLAEDGYEVVATVDNLADAAQVLDSEQVDLVLSDIRLRGDGDGMDVARAAAAKSIPVLFVSGRCPVEAQSLAVGCLAKPYTDKMLKAALETLDAKLSGRRTSSLPAGLSLYLKA